MSFKIVNRKTKKIIIVSQEDLKKYPVNDWMLFDKLSEKLKKALGLSGD